MLRTVLFDALLVVVFLPCVQAQNPADRRTPEQVVRHHWEAFSHHDLEAVLSDYAEDAIFIASNQTVQGKTALRQMFSRYFSGATGAHTQRSFDVKITTDGEVGYEHWVSDAGKPGAIEGTDAFVVRHGRILFHTVVGVHAAGAQK
jgi:ketosteroid isomerase-like protein